MKKSNSRKCCRCFFKTNFLLLSALITITPSHSYANYSLNILDGNENKIIKLFEKLPLETLSNKLLPHHDNWQGTLLRDLHSQIDIPYDSLFEFVNEQEEFQGALEVLEQLPAPIITVATPTQGSNADFVAVAAATTWANQALYLTEISFEFLSSHIGATMGLSTAGGLGTSAGLGVTTGLSATGGAGLAAGVGVTAGTGIGMGVNTGAGGSITVGAGASLGLPITLNDIVTNTFNTLRPRVWRVNTLSGEDVKTVSPILMTIGNPDQNPQTARLNDDLPIYFDKEAGSDEWFMVQRRNDRVFDGHVGIISLSSHLPLPELDFSDGVIGLDLVTMVIAATDEEGMTAVASLLQQDENGARDEKLEVLTAYLNGLMGKGMNLADKLKRLKHFTDLSTTAWSKSESPFSLLSKRGFEKNKSKLIARAKDSNTGKLLHKLAEKSQIKARIENSWVANAALSPDLLSGQALLPARNTASTGTDPISRGDILKGIENLASYPMGISLVVIADDEGIPQIIQLVAN
ncbi:MAG: hypothetical protein KUG83_03645 [Gammaproteobacteria bacterium]|nr:hypothetical protein [Gammaproteobacteria bacterium]